MSRRSASTLCVLVLLALPACGASESGASVTPDPPATAVPLTTTLPPVEAPPTSVAVQSAAQGSVVVAATDEVYLDTSSGQLIHRDQAGIYICLLLRPDDLAAYRPSYKKSTAVEEESPQVVLSATP